jgi:prephenate dehydratase
MALPEANLSTIKTVQSHVHAIGQCRKIVRKLGLKALVTGDTAGSAREVAESGDITKASLAPRLAAGIYGLKILAEDVEDESYNTTRFIILSKTPKRAAPDDGPIVTSFIFRVRNLPAALYKALGGFATNGVNMTKLESYMLEGDFTATQFYAEVDGHPDDVHVRRALEELEFFSRELRILGVYPAHPFRDEVRPAAE